MQAPRRSGWRFRGDQKTLNMVAIRSSMLRFRPLWFQVQSSIGVATKRTSSASPIAVRETTTIPTR